MQVILMKRGGVTCQPVETVLDGAPCDLEDAGGLTLTHAGDKQAQAGGVEVGLLLTAIGSE